MCNNIVRKLYAVYWLNVADWVCTVLLLRTGLFYEANPIARTFIFSIPIGFCVKCVAVFVVVYFVSKYMHILEWQQLRVADMLISFTFTVYLAIIVDHTVNFIVFLLK